MVCHEPFSLRDPSSTKIYLLEDLIMVEKEYGNFFSSKIAL